MDSKSIRTIVILGVIATFLLTMMMMFTLDQVADTQTPQIADDISKEFEPALAPTPPANVHLTMSRDGKGVLARRVYKLRLAPSAAVAADPRSVARLMYHASSLCASEIGELKCEVAIQCVAELPGGGEKEIFYVRDKAGPDSGVDPIHEVASLPPAAPTEAAQR